MESFNELSHRRKISYLENLQDEEKRIELTEKEDFKIGEKLIIYKDLKKRLDKKIQTYKEVLEYIPGDYGVIADKDFIIKGIESIFESAEKKEDLIDILDISINSEKFDLICKKYRQDISWILQVFISYIKDEKLKFNMLRYVKEKGVDISNKYFISQVDSYNNANRLLKYLDLTEIEKIQIGLNIKDKQKGEKWLKDETSFYDIKEELETKQFKGETIGLPEKLKFGVELESEGIERDFLQTLRMQINTDKLSEWEIKNDVSLVNGAEMTSPILYDKKICMKQIEFACMFLKNFGAKTSERCGGHIHFGADYLGKNYKAWENFITIWNETEEILYKMSNKQGESPREDIVKYASTQAQNINSIDNGNIKIKNQQDLYKLLYFIGQSRDYGMSLKTLMKSRFSNRVKDTIEIRMPNGTIDSDTLKHNILLFGRIITKAKELVENPSQEFELLKDKRLTEAEKVEVLLDLLFDEEEQKNYYRDRWKSVRDNTFFEKVKSNIPTFIRGNYKKRDGFEEILVSAKNDRNHRIGKLEEATEQIKQFVNKNQTNGRIENYEHTRL